MNAWICSCFSKAAFRDQLIAASLKPVHTRQPQQECSIFPRSIDRGLIEARRTPPADLRLQNFPRSIDRGLIEAQPGGLRPGSLRPFPRSIDRSLIGAICPLTTLDTGLSFRDQIDRGLTKRHCESSLVVFCNTLDSGS